MSPVHVRRPWGRLLPSRLSVTALVLALGLAGCGDDRAQTARPELVAPGAAVDFGAVPVLNEKSVEVTLGNVGRAPLKVLSVALRESDVPFRLGEHATAVEAGADAQLKVTFQPPAEAPYAATLVIETDDVETPRVEVALTGVGSTRAVMEVEPLVLDFGRVNEGSAAVKSFRVRSKGSADLVLNALGFTPESSPAFSFVGSAKTPAVIPHQENGLPGEIQLTVKYTVAAGAPETATGAVRLEGTDPDLREALVQLTGAVNRAPLAVIAPLANAAPGMTVTLDGTGSSDPDNDTPLTYRWTLRQRPIGAEATLGAPDAATTTLTLDDKIPGSYEVELQVTDALGAKNVLPTRVTIVSSPAQKLLVQVSWNKSFPDIDLHVLRNPTAQLGTLPDDCYYGNKTPDWGAAGDPTDDPELLRHPLAGGYGPEVFGYENPVDGSYRLIVEYFHDNGAPDPDTEVTVQIYQFGVLQAELKKTLKQRSELWTVADIDWPSGNITTLGGP